MKHYYTILLFIFLVGEGRAQTVPAESMVRLMDSVRIDSLENRNFQRLSQKTGKVIDSVLSDAAEAMQASERLGYTHGKAVALAVEAITMDLHVNDFIRAEGLARQ